MYYLGGRGGEDFINQYSIFSYPPTQFPENFVCPREDGSDFVIPPLLEFESFWYWNDMQWLQFIAPVTWGRGGFEPQVGPG